MNITVDKTELVEIIREIIKEELLKLTIKLTPYVSTEEMQEIDKSLSEKDLSDNDFVPGVKWLGR